MAVSHGMSVEEVERLAQHLRDNGARIAQLAAALDREVGTAVWRGRDAERFKHDWWPGHRSALLRVGEDLEGFGQSAANNAAEQRAASRGTGSAGPAIGGAGAAAVAAVGASDAGTSSATTGATSADANAPGASTGTLPGAGRSWADVSSDYASRGEEFGLKAVHRSGGGLDDQCVAWATYRWQEIRAEAVLDLSPTPQGAGWHGGRLAEFFGGEQGVEPTLGAMVSYDTGDAYGHVMIVEQVGRTTNGAMTVSVSEFNVPYGSGQDALGGTARVFTQLDDEKWRSPGGSIHTFTVANH